jgi:hypothetical protein
MQALLQTASRLVVDIMGLEHCSIGWLNDNEFGIEIWTSHTRDGAEVNHSRVHKAFSGMINRKRAKPVEKPVDPRHRLDASQAVMGKREIVSPLRVDKQIVGYVCGLKSEFSEETILATEKSLFSALSEHISAAIEAQRTREMLDSPYVALALTPVERECLAGLTPTDRPFLSPVNDPERLVRKIARRFFADLYRAGFEIKHILYLATEILDSLLVAQHEAKSE